MRRAEKHGRGHIVRVPAVRLALAINLRLLAREGETHYRKHQATASSL
jgi:hypothetical protein